MNRKITEALLSFTMLFSNPAMITANAEETTTGEENTGEIAETEETTEVSQESDSLETNETEEDQLNEENSETEEPKDIEEEEKDNADIDAVNDEDRVAEDESETITDEEELNNDPVIDITFDKTTVNYDSKATIQLTFPDEPDSLYSVSITMASDETETKKDLNLKYNDETQQYASEINYNQIPCLGTWFVETVKLTDAVGNKTVLSYESGQIDRKEIFFKPLFEDLQINSNYFVSGDTIHLAAKVNYDDVRRIAFVYSSPHNKDFYYFADYNNETEFFEVDTAVDDFDDSGNYTLVRIAVFYKSKYSNFSVYSSQIGENSIKTFRIDTPMPDYTPPVLNSYEINKNTVGLGGEIKVVLSITDDISGVPTSYSTPQVHYKTESGTDKGAVTTYNKETGNYEASFTFDDSDEEGDYRLSFISLKDNKDNNKSVYLSDDLGLNVLNFKFDKSIEEYETITLDIGESKTIQVGFTEGYSIVNGVPSIGYEVSGNDIFCASQTGVTVGTGSHLTFDLTGINTGKAYLTIKKKDGTVLKKYIVNVTDNVQVRETCLGNTYHTGSYSYTTEDVHYMTDDPEGVVLNSRTASCVAFYGSQYCIGSMNFVFSSPGEKTIRIYDSDERQIGISIVKVVEHDWSEWKEIDASKDERICQKCGKTEEKEFLLVLERDNYSNLIPGDELQLNAFITPSNIHERSLIWSSSNPEIASVDQTGKVTAIHGGKATITVSDESGILTKSTVINVNYAVEGLSISDDHLEMFIYDNYDLSAVITPSNASNKHITWYSENERIVSVGYGGHLTANNFGKTVITAKSDDGGYTDSCKVTVLFDDVTQPSQYYYDAVYWAVEKNITQGMGLTTFNPGGFCKRYQFVLFLWRQAGCPEPELKEDPFTDVLSDPKKDVYEKAVLWAVDQEITTGTTPTTFDPYAPLTRGQVVTFLYRAAGKPEVSTTTNPFKDLDSSKYYYTPVLWAVENGITTGLNKTQFGPTNTCTRGQTVLFMYRLFGKEQ